MNERGLRCHPHVPTTGLGLTLGAVIVWSYVAESTPPERALVLGGVAAYVLGVHVLVHHLEGEVLLQRGMARAAAASSRSQEERCRAEEQRAWLLVDRIVALENEVRRVRHQSDEWTSSVLAHVDELQRQLQTDPRRLVEVGD